MEELAGAEELEATWVMLNEFCVFPTPPLGCSDKIKTDCCSSSRATSRDPTGDNLYRSLWNLERS